MLSGSRPWSPGRAPTRVSAVIEQTPATQQMQHEPTLDRTCPACGAMRQHRGVDGVEAELTTREVTVLDLVAEGMTDRQIARRLGISPRTVDKHLEHIYSKLEIRGRVAVAVRWLTQGHAPGVGTPVRPPRQRVAQARSRVPGVRS